MITKSEQGEIGVSLAVVGLGMLFLAALILAILPADVLAGAWKALLSALMGG